MANNVGQEIADALGILLRRGTRARLYQRLTDGLGPAVDEVSYPVLSGLDRTGPCSAAELAGEIGLDRSGVTRRATRLEQAGLLHRRPDPADGRATLLALTDTGRETVAAMRLRLAADIEDSLAAWPAGEATAFARGLRHFVTEGPFTEGLSAEAAAAHD